MTAVLSPLAKQSFLDNNGRPLVGGKLFTYIAGTTTKQPTYVDSAQGTPNSNPVLLDYRGECNLWVPPNVGYKYVLAPSTDTDPPTHSIWTVDNLVSSQLITLYGGTDTGSINAYVLTFSANFTSYTDGTIIFWTPANTNTGASTININGLGIISLLNQNGSALRAGQVVANFTTSILIKAGQALLLSGSFAGGVLAVDGSSASPSIAFAADTSTGFYRPGASQIGISLNGTAGVIATGIAACTLSGVVGTVNVNCPYSILNNICTLAIPQASGTSNSTSFGLSSTTTAAIRPTKTQWLSLPAMQDNGANVFAQVGTVAPGGVGVTTFTFYKNGSSTGWTAAGTKGAGDTAVDSIYNIVQYLLN